MSGPPAPKEPEPDRPVPVAVLASMIDGALRTGLPASVRVIGEISNFNERTHWYFRLKDEEAAVDCVMFASASRRVRVRPENGHKVIAAGRVDANAGIIRADGTVATSDGAVEIVELQPEGKRPMPLAAFRNGHRWDAGMRLESVA